MEPKYGLSEEHVAERIFARLESVSEGRNLLNANVGMYSGRLEIRAAL